METRWELYLSVFLAKHLPVLTLDMADASV